MFTIDRSSIRDLSVTYDEVFKRFEDSRGFIPPLKISTEARTLYVFTKPLGKRRLLENKIFKGANKYIESWYRGFSDD